jgi:hypothetical protein
MSAFLENLWANVAAGLILLVVGRVGVAIWRLARQLWQGTQPFSLTGTWIGLCRMPGYPLGVVAVEVYRLVVRKEHVSITFFNYRPDAPSVPKYVGAGVLRGQVLSAFYHSPDSKNAESGVLSLRLTGQKLRGVYAQYDLQTPGEVLIVSGDTFELARIAVPLLVQARMAFGWKPYQKHVEAHAVLQRASGGD